MATSASVRWSVGWGLLAASVVSVLLSIRYDIIVWSVVACVLFLAGFWWLAYTSEHNTAGETDP